MWTGDEVRSRPTEKRTMELQKEIPTYINEIAEKHIPTR